MLGPSRTPTASAQRGGLRAVPDGPDAGTRPLAGVRPARPAAEGGPLLRVAKADDQSRLAATKILAPLRWTPGTELVAHLDATAHLAWVQAAVLPGGGHDVDGTRCDCDRCTAAVAAVPALPGDARRHEAEVSIDAKGQLCLTRGLLAAAGLSAPGETVVVVVADLHALAIAAHATVLAGRLAHLVMGLPPGAAADEVADTTLTAADHTS